MIFSIDDGIGLYRSRCLLRRISVNVVPTLSLELYHYLTQIYCFIRYFVDLFYFKSPFNVLESFLSLLEHENYIFVLIEQVDQKHISTLKNHVCGSFAIVVVPVKIHIQIMLNYSLKITIMV